MTYLFDIVKQIHDLWWLVLAQPIASCLAWLYHLFAAVPLLEFIGAYGVSIVVFAFLVRVLLAPMYQWGLRLRRAQAHIERDPISILSAIVYSLAELLIVFTLYWVVLVNVSHIPRGPWRPGASPG